MGSRLLLSVWLLAFAAGCAGVREAAPPRIGVSDIRMLSGGLLEQRLEVTLRIGNPNDFDLPLEGLAFDLDINEQPFAHGLTNEAVVVPRLGEVTLPVEATAGVLEMMQQILTLGERRDLSYRLAGRVHVRGPGSRTLPFELSGRLRLMPEPAGVTTLVPL